MKRLIYPGQVDIRAALGRPSAGNTDIDGTVREVLDRVRAQGDAALFKQFAGALTQSSAFLDCNFQYAHLTFLFAHP